MRGFTLVEALLSLAIIAIITGLSAPVYFSYSTRNNLGLAVDAGVQSLRRAQFLALNQERDSNWGTYFSTSSITLYNGNDYSTRNVNYDERYDLPTTVTSTVADVNFNKFTGEANETSTVLNTVSDNLSDSYTIRVNLKGMVDY